MRKKPCAALAELRSAYVDGALGHDDRDRLLTHLVRCHSCRHDVAELRAVRELVGRTPDPHPSAPADLSARLVSIAGSDYDVPLHSRSLRPSGARSLPSVRRIARLRAAAAGVALAVTATTVSVTGYLAAPAELATVSDPSAEAEAEFGSALGRSPLVSDSVAMLLVSAGSSSRPQSVAGSAPPVATGDPLNATETQQGLKKAVTAANSISYAGDQVFSARSMTGTSLAQLRVVNTAGQGTQVNVVKQPGDRAVSGFAPAPTSTRLVDTGLLGLLEVNYVLTGARGGSVVGRPATMLQASRNGVVASRWWVDDATGLVLWQNTYDQDADLQVSVGFTRLDITPIGPRADHLPPMMAAGSAKTALTLSNAQPLTTAGWFCANGLAGLTLVELRADRSSDPSALHLTYSDGLRTVTVYEQRGRLGADPKTFAWADALGAYVRPGSASLATWQSGDRVFTVMTDGSAEQLAQVVGVLPHDAPHERTTMERIQAGWADIAAHMKG